MSTTELLEDLKNRTKQVVADFESLKSLSDSELDFRTAKSSWSVLECLEHLNRYGDFYLPEIRSRIDNSKYATTGVFRSGWLGDYFAKSMLPGENGKLNKMKTFREMNPLGSSLDRHVLDRFEKQQKVLLTLLTDAQSVDLSRTKTSISISKWIKLRLGDTLRVVIYHNQRHMAQAIRLLTSKGVAQPTLK